MLTEIRIQNFRGFKDLTVAPLKRVNLFVSKNNVGKTSFLEAIALLTNGGGDIQNLPRMLRNSSHPDQGAEFWSWIFSDRDLERKIAVSAKDGTNDISIEIVSMGSGQNQPAQFDHALDFGIGDKRYRLWIRTEPEKSGTRQMRNRSGLTGGAKAFSTNPLDPIEESRKYHEVMLKKNGEENAERLLKVVEPRLHKIRPGMVGNNPSVYADINLPEQIPVSQLGQGFCRLLSIYSSMFLAKAKVFLIDEIENGIHYSALEQVWKGIAEIAVLEDVQVFATTHSWECIVAAQKVFAERDEYDLAVHRLQISNGVVESKTFDKETLGTALANGFELR